MSDKIVVHIVGTGTIGLPLIGLLNRYKTQFGIDEVTFHKNTPTKTDIASIKRLIEEGAILSTDEDKILGFNLLGVQPIFTRVEAVKRATVVIDCTPKGIGLKNKQEFYEPFKDTVKGFVAQGSENGFGEPFAYKINNEALTSDEKFIQVVSCNTHNITALLKLFSNYFISDAKFVCLRRASDISQNDDAVLGVKVDKHKDDLFGTHHAHDAFRVLKTIDFFKADNPLYPIPTLYSSSCVLPTQYMHAIHYSITVKVPISERDELVEYIKKYANTMLAITEKNSTNTVFSFGRDHGHFGRILNQGVLPLDTLSVRSKDTGDQEINGFCFTSQDGNSLLSSVASTLWFIYKDWTEVEQRLKFLDKYLFKEI